MFPAPARIIVSACLLALSTSSVTAQYTPPASNRTSFNFNYDWKFIKQDVPTASDTSYNDSSWTTVSVPHSWNDDKFREWIRVNSTNEPIPVNDPMRPSGTYYGKAWYRKHFTIPSTYSGRKVILEFQGIGRSGKFWVNGNLVGVHENGVGPAGIDITSFVTFGADNVIAVRVDNNERSVSEEYGFEQPYGQPFNVNYGGINRDVTLHICDKLYQTLPLYRNLGTLGTYIYSSNINTLAKTANLTVNAEVKNETGSSKSPTMEAVVVDQSGNVAWTLPITSAQAITNNGKFTFSANASISGIHFWSPDYPYLYQVYTIIRNGSTVTDVYRTTIGIRKFTFSRTFGLQVNGHPLYLNGYAPRTSMEWPAVGTPVNWLNEYDFKLMKQNNANFVRPMHVAPRKVQVEAADKFGVVMVVPAANNEGDTDESTPEGASEWQQRLDIMRDVTIYFRNNPSVLFWEGGNSGISALHMQEMLDVRLQYDPNGGRWAGTRSNDTGITDLIREYSSTMDGSDQNNRTPLWDAEYARGESPRRVWDVDSPMLNPRWNGTNPNTITNPVAGDPSNPANTTAKYLKGGYFYIASNWHQAFGLNSGNSDFIGDYLYPGGQAYFRLNSSEDMLIENLAKFWARYAKSVYIQPAAVSDAEGVMVGGAKIIWSDSATDGRMHNTEVVRLSGAVDGARIPKETFYGMQIAHADPETQPMVYIAGHWNYPSGTIRQSLFVVSNKPRVKLQTYNTSGALITDYGEGTKNFFPSGIGGDQINNYVFKFSNVAWLAGSVKATAFTTSPTESGAVTDTKTTAGTPNKLRITPVLGPQGWKADGSDVAMFDVEVLDSSNNRCPTYEDRMTFTWSGQGIFLGGYNSGIRYSTKLPDDPAASYNLNIEAGINRVFVRANRTAGSFTLNVTGTGLTSDSEVISSTAITVTNGLATELPQSYGVSLGTEPPAVQEGVAPPPPPNAPNPASISDVSNFYYTGTHAQQATLVKNVKPGQLAYMDSSSITLPSSLPRYLLGGEYIRPFKSDGGETSSTDQYQFDLNRFAYVYQVIDAANGMPKHNSNASYQWVKLPETFTLNGRTMKIYKSRMMRPYENVYLAANGHENNLSGFDSQLGFDTGSNMYLIFIVAAEQELQLPTNVVSATTVQGTNTPDKALDANPSTRWNASSGTMPQSLNIDLGRSVFVGGYKIDWYSGASRYYQYLVEISPDNTNWTTSLDMTGNVNMGTDEYRVPVTGTSGGRYIRITVSDASGGGWAAINDLEVYGILDAPVAAAVPTVTGALTASGQGGYPFSYTIAANGSPTGFAAQGLPSGFTLNGNTGVISGTTLESGTIPLTISGINTAGTGSAILNVSMAAPPPIPVITSSLTHSVQAGTAIPSASAYTIAATNMTYTPVSYGATLPTGLGLAVSSSSGKITGTPKWPGTYPIEIRATNPGGTGKATLQYTVTPNGPAPVITSGDTVTGYVGTALSYQITATNSPTRFDAAPLPPGLTRSTSTGLISGTPTATGNSSVTVTATGIGGDGTKQVQFNIAPNPNVPVITSAVTVSGNVGVAFSYTVTASPAATSFSTSTLPGGLVLNATTGVISGTPTSAAQGASTVTLTATNASGSSEPVTLTITIGAAVPAPAITCPINAVGRVGTPFSFQVTATNSPTSFAISSGTLPSGLTLNTGTGLISGTPSASVTSTVTLTAANAGGVSPGKQLTIAISPSGSDINLALNCTVTTSSVRNNNATTVGDKAVDGVSNTRWESEWSDPQWIMIDLGSTKTIHGITLNWEAAAGKNYTIETSSSSTGPWSNLITVTNNTTTGIINYTGYNRSARYVRLYGTARKTGYGYSLYEFQVLGQ